MCNTRRLPVLVWLAATFLSACRPQDPPPTPTPVIGDAQRGAQLFAQPVIGAGLAPGCRNCHLLETDQLLIGPSLAGVGARAATAVPGQTAATFLRRSITHPNEHLTDGYLPDVMYQEYAAALSEQEIADLVAFLLTLGP